jgi:hypothetical protein
MQLIYGVSGLVESSFSEPALRMLSVLLILIGPPKQISLNLSLKS